MIRTHRIALVVTAVVVMAAAVSTACGDSDESTDIDAGGDATTTSSLPAGSDDEQQTRPAGGSDVYAIADLTIDVTHPDREPVTYRLSCLGDTATIDDTSVEVSAEAACTQLTDPETVTLLIDGPDPERVCTEQYGGADEATVTGILDGDEVDVVIDRANGCGIDDWDRILGEVLPAPVGV